LLLLVIDLQYLSHNIAIIRYLTVWLLLVIVLLYISYSLAIISDWSTIHILRFGYY